MRVALVAVLSRIEVHSSILYRYQGKTNALLQERIAG